MILWSDFKIVHGTLNEIREKSEANHQLLKDSEFEVFDRQKDQKARGLKQDRIKSIHWCNKSEMLAKKQSKINPMMPRLITSYQQRNNQEPEKEEYEAVAIVVTTGSGQVHITEYILDKDVELGSLTASDKSVIFSQSGDQFMVATPDFGIINLTTKEIHLEYHTEKNKFEELFDCDTEWGDQLY